MKIGILGSGMIVPTHAETVKELEGICDVAICCEPSQIERAKELKETYQMEWLYTDYDEMLKNPAIDTIYIAVPNHLHYEKSLQALHAGKYVICEKPFTTTVKQAQHLFEEAKKHKVMIWEAIATIYLPNVLDMKQKLANIGTVRMVFSNYSQYSSRYDAFCKGTVLSAFDPKCCGGALEDINIYNLHLVTCLFGKPSEVHYFANIQKDIDTSGMVVLQYPTFQAVCIGAKDCGAPSCTQIQGEKGYIKTHTPPFIVESYEWAENKKEPVNVNCNDSKQRMKYELLAFEAMKQQQDWDAYHKAKEHTLIVVEVAQLARQSAHLSFDADRLEGR